MPTLANRGRILLNMRRAMGILFAITILLACSLWQDDSQSEETGRLIIDTIYARITVGTFKERSCKDVCAACDVIIGYRFGSYAGFIPTIEIHALESKTRCRYDRDFGMHPAEMPIRDSLRCYFPEAYEGIDTAHVRVWLDGSCYDIVGDGDARQFIPRGPVSYVDTLVVPIQRAK
jgi:hypothetical protein